MLAERVHRGFHRIGLAIAGASFLVGLLAFFVYTGSETNFTDFTTPVLFGVCAYGICRLAGWIIAGFVGD